MRLKTLELTDFGQHATRTFNLDHSVVGFVGINGCGKSTILEAIRYALTGTLEENMDTYVRHGCKWGRVRLTFVKDGTQVLIERHVGSKTGRTLVIDGDEEHKKTRAADVDAAMERIMECSLAAINNAVFVRQGELADLLFGQDTEQNAMFMRMLLVDYIDGHGTQLEKQIKVLSSGVQDYSASEATAQIALDEALARHVEAKQRFDGLLNWSKASDNFDVYLQASTDCSRHASSQLELRRDVEALNQGWRSALAQLTPPMTRHEDLTGLLASEGKRIEGLRLHKQRLERVAELQGDLDKQVAEVKRSRAQADRADTMKKAYLAEFSDESAVEKRIAEVQTKINQVAIASRRLTAVQEATNDVTAGKQSVVEAKTALDASPVNATWRAEKDAALAKMTDQGKEWRGQLAIAEKAKELLKDASCGDDKCPLCRQKISSDLLALFDVDKITADMAALRTQYAAEKDAFDKALAKHEQLERELMTNKRELELVESRLAKAQAELQPDDAKLAQLDQAALSEEIGQLQNQLRLARQQTQLATTARDSAEKADAQAVELSGRLDTAKLEIDASLTRDTGVLNREITEGDRNLEELRGKHKAIMSSVDRAAELQQQLDKTVALLKTAQKVCDDAKAELHSEVVHLMEEKQLPPDVLRQAVHEQRDAYLQLKGEIDGLATAVTEQRKQLDEIQRRIAENADLQAKLNKLRQIRTLFSKNGLPFLYVQEAFKELLPEVSARLAQMQSRFAVRLSEEKSCTFEFARADLGLDGCYWLPQVKLSGGERVRLTVAFLLAVQRIVLPNLGFLVLDEPSLHLDAESVEGLGMLLRGLEAIFTASQHQLLLVDHNTALTAAVPAIIKLP